MPTRLHNEIRDILCNISAMVWPQVKREVIVKEADENGTGGLVAEFSACGVWETLFDVCIVNADAPSYGNHSMHIERS